MIQMSQEYAGDRIIRINIIRYTVAEPINLWHLIGSAGGVRTPHMAMSYAGAANQAPSASDHPVRRSPSYLDMQVEAEDRRPGRRCSCNPTAPGGGSGAGNL